MTHSAHTLLALADALISPRQDLWTARGWMLEPSDSGWVITGDTTQFYLDAAADDADAALVLAFLETYAPEEFRQFVDMGEDDGLDLADSLPVFLLNRPFDEALALRNSRL